MSEASNPLFDSEKEYLERQKEEYKNALLGNVAEIKDQSQKIGKIAMIAGGAIVGVWLLSKLLKKRSKNELSHPQQDYNLLGHHSYKPHLPHPALHAEYNSQVHEREDEMTLSSEHPNYKHLRQSQAAHAQHHSSFGTVARSFMNSELVTMITHQLTALLMIYITKKVEEYLNLSKNHDIAVENEADTKDIDFTYHAEPDVSR